MHALDSSPTGVVHVTEGGIPFEGDSGAAGHAGLGGTTAENGFVPELPKGHPVDVIYLCFPNNPTGTVITKQELRKWVNYALKNDALILFDAAYQAYIQDPDIPPIR